MSNKYITLNEGGSSSFAPVLVEFPQGMTWALPSFFFFPFISPYFFYRTILFFLNREQQESEICHSRNHMKFQKPLEYYSEHFKPQPLSLSITGWQQHSLRFNKHTDDLAVTYVCKIGSRGFQVLQFRQLSDWQHQRGDAQWLTKRYLRNSSPDLCFFSSKKDTMGGSS